MHFNQDLFHFVIECILFLLVISAGFFVVGFLLNLLSRKIRSNLAGLLGEKGFLILFFPGIAVHEISHALASVLFLHKVEDINLFSLRGQNGAHGYVTARPLTLPKILYIPQIWQSMGHLFIGIAPLVIGPGLMLLWFYFLPGGRAFLQSPSLHTWPVMSLQLGIWMYTTFATLSNIELSDADLQGTWKGYAFVILSVLILSLTCGQISPALRKNGLPKKYWSAVGLSRLPVFKNRQQQ